jgi:hypothetical protein
LKPTVGVGCSFSHPVEWQVSIVPPIISFFLWDGCVLFTLFENAGDDLFAVYTSSIGTLGDFTQLFKMGLVWPLGINDLAMVVPLTLFKPVFPKNDYTVCLYRRRKFGRNLMKFGERHQTSNPQLYRDQGGLVILGKT